MKLNIRTLFTPLCVQAGRMWSNVVCKCFYITVRDSPGPTNVTIKTVCVEILKQTQPLSFTTLVPGITLLFWFQRSTVDVQKPHSIASLSLMAPLSQPRPEVSSAEIPTPMRHPLSYPHTIFKGTKVQGKHLKKIVRDCTHCTVELNLCSD